MAHRIIFEDDITSPHRDKAVDIEIDENETNTENITTKNIDTGKAITENHGNMNKPTNNPNILIDNDVNLSNSDGNNVNQGADNQNEIITNSQQGDDTKQNNITTNTNKEHSSVDNYDVDKDDITQTEGETIPNLKTEKNCSKTGKKGKKKPSELERLGVDVTIKNDWSEGKYDVFGDDSKVYKKYKLRKSEQTISYKEPPNLKPERFISSDDEEIKKESLECDICDQYFNSKLALTNHLRIHMTAPQYKCSICSMKFENNTDLIAHKSEHTEAFLCKMCKLAFSDHCDYLIHNLIHTPKLRIKCPECGLSYKKHSFKIHICTHFDKKVTCHICSFVTNGEFNLQNHINTQHKNKFTCVECGKVSKSTKMFHYHMSIHTGVKKFQCLYCGKGFKTNNMRKIHTRTHTDERPFKCDICGQNFKQHTDLNSHKITHETEKKYACDICGKKYFYKYYMEAHKRAHEVKEKTYQCPECDYSTMVLGALKTHIMYRHVDGVERPVECKFCNKRFINNSAFNKHRASKYHRNNVYGSKIKNDKKE